jgi:RNA polymerase sigma-70 factor (ECF subfamily)
LYFLAGIGGSVPSITHTDIERWFLKFEKPLYNFVYRWVWHPEESHDIVQEIFVRLWEHRDHIDEKTIQALIYKIALNLARNHHRKKTTLKNLFYHLINRQRDEGQTDHGWQTEKEQQEHLVRAVVDTLPEHYRSVLMLCQFSEMSYEEVAGILKVPAGTVASRKNKALEILKEKLVQKGIYGIQ